MSHRPHPSNLESAGSSRDARPGSRRVRACVLAVGLAAVLSGGLAAGGRGGSRPRAVVCPPGVPRSVLPVAPLIPVKPGAPQEPVRRSPSAARWSAQLTPLRALWVWGDDAVDLLTNRPGARAALFDEVVPARVPGAPPVTLVFVDDPFDLLFRPQASAPYSLASMRNLLADLHAHGIEAHLVACAHPPWSGGRGCIEQTVTQVLRFNDAGTGDTSWDGVQLTTAPATGPWRPYAPGTDEAMSWTVLRAEVASGARLLEGRLPFGVTVGGSWLEAPGLGDPAFLRDADYVAVMPYADDAASILERIAPWRALGPRFVIGIELEDRTDPTHIPSARDPAFVGPIPPWERGADGVWSGDYGALEQLATDVVNRLDLAAPLVGFAYSGLERYRRVPPPVTAHVEAPATAEAPPGSP